MPPVINRVNERWKAKTKTVLGERVTGLEEGLAGLLKRSEMVNQANFERFVRIIKTTVNSEKIDRYILTCIAQHECSLTKRLQQRSLSKQWTIVLQCVIVIFCWPSGYLRDYPIEDWYHHLLLITITP